jgi:hypothetical protein
VLLARQQRADRICTPSRKRGGTAQKPAKSQLRIWLESWPELPVPGMTVRPGTFLQSSAKYADFIHGRATVDARIIMSPAAAECLKVQT